jgi:hypothetical protein
MAAEVPKLIEVEVKGSVSHAVFRNIVSEWVLVFAYYAFQFAQTELVVYI